LCHLSLDFLELGVPALAVMLASSPFIAQQLGQQIPPLICV
jgi:hypothetical protein